MPGTLLPGEYEAQRAATITMSVAKSAMEATMAAKPDLYLIVRCLRWQYAGLSLFFFLLFYTWLVVKKRNTPLTFTLSFLVYTER